MTVDELREALADLPGHHEVVVSVEVAYEWGESTVYSADPAEVRQGEFCTVVLR